MTDEQCLGPKLFRDVLRNVEKISLVMFLSEFIIEAPTVSWRRAYLEGRMYNVYQCNSNYEVLFTVPKIHSSCHPSVLVLLKEPWHNKNDSD